MVGGFIDVGYGSACVTRKLARFLNENLGARRGETLAGKIRSVQIFFDRKEECSIGQRGHRFTAFKLAIEAKVRPIS